MREAAGVDDCWTHDVIGDWQQIAAGKVNCKCGNEKDPLSQAVLDHVSG